MLQEPRRVPPSADGGRGSNRVFRRRVRRKTHFPGRKCANREPKQSPAKRVCLGEKGQGSGVNPGRQAGANGADFDPTKCAQRPASPRKNACIFEKRVEVFRHAGRTPVWYPHGSSLRLSIKYISSIYAARASQSSAVRRRRKRVKSCFPAACTSENTLPRPQVCERKRVRAAACIPSKKCLHF